MKAILAILGLSVLGWTAWCLQATEPAPPPAKQQRMSQDRILGWAVVDHRFAEGPFAGYWVGVSPPREDKFVLSDREWQRILKPEQYRILRNKGTEPAFCGRFHDHKADGFYRVIGSGQPVFKSSAKFDSGTGWPSFFEPYDRDAIWLKPDFSHGMTRLEVLASRCDGHLGHVFPDGPREKGGLRFCINSEVLEFVPTTKGE
jgi:peptide-methionine (R)-S-oxide reductase